jgi:TonB family protein
MRPLAVILISFLCICGNVCSQSASHPEETNANGPVSVMKVGPGTTVPTLLPVDFSEIIAAKCERKFHGKTEIALIVDARGTARNMQFLRPAANDIDRLAIAIAEMERFTPATQTGVAVAIGESMELKIDGCIESVLDSVGNKTYRLKLVSPPIQKLKRYDGYPTKVIFAREQFPPNPRSVAPDRLHKVGGSVSSPVPLSTPEAEYSDEGRRKNINGKCLVSLFVDSYGLPRDLMLMRSLEPTMDQKALEAVNRYRFKPALRDGLEPVPVMITIEVNFQRW